MSIQIVSVNVGMPQMLHYNSDELTTGIMKKKVTEPSIVLTRLGLAGDGQADLIHHGGADKALCVYSYEHYPYWEKELQTPLVEGAFGENLTVLGLMENQVFIGDIFSIGEIILQVSQPRQPCHKLAKRHNRSDLPALVQKSGYTGFYFRVLAPGQFDIQLPLTLQTRHFAGISISMANQIFYTEKDNKTAMMRLLEVTELSESWRSVLERRIFE